LTPPGLGRCVQMFVRFGATNRRCHHRAPMNDGGSPPPGKEETGDVWAEGNGEGEWCERNCKAITSTQMPLKLISAQRLLYIAQKQYACTHIFRDACAHPPNRLYAKIRDLKSRQAKEAWQPHANRTCAQVWARHV